MASYSGADKRLKYLFDNIMHDYSTTGHQIGMWMGSPLYEEILVATISSASSEDETIANLSGYANNYQEIVSANLDTGSEFWPITHELHIDGNAVKYTGAHGTGTAYITLHYC